jgi:HD-like signal output (HDOD) protein
MLATTIPSAAAASGTKPKNSIAWAGDLPALPAAVLDLLALVNAEDVDIDELSARISVDMALTAKILRLANSSFYGARGEVTSVDAAVARVGLRMVKGIVTAAAVSGSIKPPVCPGFDFAAFWRHGVATATAAQMLAFATGADSSTAFTSGLLYRVGQLVMAAQAPDHFSQVLAFRAALGGDTIEIERRLLGVDHAVVGAQVAAHWRLPALIVEALAQQDPPLATGQAPTLGQVAGAADRLIEAAEAGTDPSAAGAGVAAAAWAAAGASAGFWAPTAADALRQAEAISSALSA